MNTINEFLKNIRLAWSPSIVIAITTIVSVGISIYCLSSGYFIIFQNLFYIPIIIACMYYIKRGLAFSVIIACIYFVLTIAFTRDSVTLLQALVRVAIFVLVAGVVTYLTSARNRAEKRVVDRTFQLESANKELDAFAYSVSHDLRAPLRSIDGFSQALLQGYPDKLDEQGKHHLQRIISGTQRMGELMDDLLKLSGIIRSEMKLEIVNLSTLAQSIATGLQKAEPERQVEFVIMPGLSAKGDMGLLRLVLENLLGNAWKYTGKHPQARIEFGSTQVDGKQVFLVRDDGAGFDMTYADKILAPFQRLHSVSEFPGTGIGLATVQRIVNRHGGRVWAEGEIEKGATFYFTLAEI